MSTILRFPVERVRPAHANIFESEEATILILPVVRIDRGEGEDVLSPSENDSGASGGRTGGRRRAPRG